MVVLMATSEPSSRSQLLCEQVWAKLLPNHVINYVSIRKCALHFPCCWFPDSVSTLRGSYGRCNGWCLIRVLTLVSTIFPVNFLIKLLF